MGLTHAEQKKKINIDQHSSSTDIARSNHAVCSSFEIDRESERGARKFATHGGFLLCTHKLYLRVANPLHGDETIITFTKYSCQLASCERQTHMGKNTHAWICISRTTFRLKHFVVCREIYSTSRQIRQIACTVDVAKG